MNIGLTCILRERKRQIEVEGWTIAHDDKHEDGELFRAAECYRFAGDLERLILSNQTPEEIIPAPKDWPWELSWWKPASNPRRNYEKAGALYLAEKERIERTGLPHLISRAGACADCIEACAAHINSTLSPFVRLFNRQQEAAFETSKSKGFHDMDNGSVEQNGNRMMLIVSEVGEAHDALRHGNPPDSHIPEFSGAEAELADVVIRCFDTAETNGWNLAEAIEAKMKYNEGRPFMHGKKC